MTTDSSNRDCDGCPIERRGFLRDAGVAAAAALVALGIPAGSVGALPMRLVRAMSANDTERAYAIPSADGVDIDKEESVIVARFQSVLYAFSLSCPHQNTALKWDERDNAFNCPKHHSQFQPNGEYIAKSGRATRNMDRFAIVKDGSSIRVDVDKLYREDDNTEQWTAAIVKI
jgi:Rieske Fe-S protein